MRNRSFQSLAAAVLVLSGLIAGCAQKQHVMTLAERMAQDAAEAVQCQKNMDDIAWGIEQYRQTHDGDCPEQLTDLLPVRLVEVPVCPSFHVHGKEAQSLLYQYNYLVIPLKDTEDRKQGFEIRCYHHCIVDGQDRYHGFAVSANLHAWQKEDDVRWRDNPMPDHNP